MLSSESRLACLVFDHHIPFSFLISLILFYMYPIPPPIHRVRFLSYFSTKEKLKKKNLYTPPIFKAHKSHNTHTRAILCEYNSDIDAVSIYLYIV